MPLSGAAVSKLKVLRAELVYLMKAASFLGDTDLTLANADWAPTSAYLRPEILLHTQGVAGYGNSGHRTAVWFTVVGIYESFPVTLSALDGLITDNGAKDGVVDALALIGQRVSQLSDPQLSQGRKALSSLRKVLKR